MQNNVRLGNLYLLAFEYSSQAELARKLEIEHKEIVRFFKNKNLSVSDEFARKIELSLNKPLGWMDRENIELALSNEEWRLVQAYRKGSDRDKLFIISLANLII